jgi:hypothetical protein
MSQARKERFLHLVTQARSNPELAQRVASRLPEQLRLAFIDQLAQPAPAPAVKGARPGPRKCKTVSAAQNGFTAQLNMFARSVSRVS